MERRTTAKAPRRIQATGPDILVLCAVVAALLVPFVGIAFHVDEPLFLWAAHHIRRHPGDPYGFTVNWYGFDMRMSDVTKNPPLTSYYIALIASLIGWSEVGLHLAFLLPALATVVGAYLVASRFCRHPLVAALVGLVTPVFLVSSLTVMSDVLMLAFWVFAVHFWLKAVDTKRHGLFVLAALLIACSALSKYFGVMLVPLLLTYTATRERRPRVWMLYLLIPLVILAWYEWATARLYGHGLLLDAASYASGTGHALGVISFPKALTAIAFTGACVASVLLFSQRLWSWRVVFAGLGLAIITALVAQTWTRLGSFEFPTSENAHWLLSAQIGLWTAGGVSLAAIACADLLRSRDADSLLLFLWIAGTFVFAAFVNWSTNGRSILPMIVPAGILIVRRLELRAARDGALDTRAVLIPLATTALLSLLVVRADYQLAGTARQAAVLIHDRHSPAGRTTWFQGHWGFQYYMEQLGAKPVERRSAFTPGDVVAIPTTNTGLFVMPSEWTATSAVVDLPASRWVATMNSAVGAGFYADTFGPLPYAVGSVPDERFTILGIRP